MCLLKETNIILHITTLEDHQGNVIFAHAHAPLVSRVQNATEGGVRALGNGSSGN